jgi:hypothetical protein
MKKAFISLVILLYLFGVLLRIIGQKMNGTAIDWKATLTLGEFDGSQDYGPRWKARIALMIALPFLWLYYGGKRFFEKLL